MPQGTTFTPAEMRAATEAVKATVSSVKHGKVMLNLDGPVLENPSHPLKRTRSLDTGQRETDVFREKRSVLTRKPRLPNLFFFFHKKNCRNFDARVTLGHSSLFSGGTSHYERIAVRVWFPVTLKLKEVTVLLWKLSLR